MSGLALVKLRAFGKTGLEVPVVGFGAGHIGQMDYAPAERLMDRALELGVTLLDTAPSYGASQEWTGRFLSSNGRRARCVVSTKCGYDVPGHADWTPGCIREGVELLLRQLRVDALDILHFHSCPVEVLERPGVVDALVAAVSAGKVRVAAYSGEGDALAWAIRSGAFGSVQTSVSLVDQSGLRGALREAGARGLGVIAKRPLGNAPWRFGARPQAQDLAIYWERFQQLALAQPPGGWEELAVRFVLSSPEVSTMIVGTSRPEHLERAVAAAERGPLDAPTLSAVRDAFERVGRDWQGVI